MTNQVSLSCPLLPAGDLVDIVCTVVGFDIHDHCATNRFYEEFANVDAYAELREGNTTISVTTTASMVHRYLDTLPSRIATALFGVRVTEVTVQPVVA